MRTCLILLCCLLFNSIHAQQKSDSLTTCCISCKEDSSRYLACQSLAYDLAYDEPEKALQLGRKAETIAITLKDKNKLAEVYENFGSCYDALKKYDTAYIYYQKALVLATDTKNTARLGKILNDIGISYYFQSKLDSALFWHFKALEERKKLGDIKEIARSYNNIGLVCRMQRDYPNAIYYYRASLAIKTKLGDKQGIVNTLMNIGSCYKNMKIYDSSLLYFRQTLVVAESNKIIRDELSAKSNIALCLSSLKRFDSAIIYFTEVMNNPLSKKDINNYPETISGLGETYYLQGKYEDAEKYLKESLIWTNKGQKTELNSTVHALLASIYEHKSAFKEALFHYQQYKKIHDSLITESNQTTISEMQARFQVTQGEQKIIQQNLELKEKRKQQLLYLLSIGIIFIISISIYILYRNKQKTSKKLEEKNEIISKQLSEKEILLKEIHHRVKNNLQVISSLLSLQSKSISDEKALEAIKEGRDRVKSMALIHQNLYQEDNLMGVDVQDYIGKLTQSLITSYNIQPDNIALITDIDKLRLDVDTVVPLGLILNELISNSLKYAFDEDKKDGEIYVQLKATPEALLLQVKDNGKGLPNDWDYNRLQSLGFQLIRAFATKMKAELIIDGKQGTNIQMRIANYKLVK